MERDTEDSSTLAAKMLMVRHEEGGVWVARLRLPSAEDELREESSSLCPRASTGRLSSVFRLLVNHTGRGPHEETFRPRTLASSHLVCQLLCS